MARLIDEFGFEGYGRFWRILEIVAERMDGTDRCRVELPEAKWLQYLSIRRPLFCRYLLVIGQLFDIKVVTNGLLLSIEIPNLLKKRDNYTKNLQVTCKSLASKEVEVEVEVDREIDKEESKTLPPLPPKGKKKGSRTIFALPDWIPRNSWEAFIEMRKQIKKPLTPHAMSLAVRRLEDLRNRGHPPEVVLDQSTLACWQGLFEVKVGQVGERQEQPPRKMSETERGLRILEDVKNGRIGTLDDTGNSDRVARNQSLIFRGNTAS